MPRWRRSRSAGRTDLNRTWPDLQLQVLELEAVDGVEPLAERQLRAVMAAGTWPQQRAAWGAMGQGSRTMSGHKRARWAIQVVVGFAMGVSGALAVSCTGDAPRALCIREARACDLSKADQCDEADECVPAEAYDADAVTDCEDGQCVWDCSGGESVRRAGVAWRSSPPWAIWSRAADGRMVPRLLQ